MSKAQRWKQQQKDKKLAEQHKKNPTPTKEVEPQTLKQRQAANKEALRAHQASMERLKKFEEKIKPAGADDKVAEPAVEKSALQDMFFDGSNLGKDLGRTQPVHAPPQPRVLHEQPQKI